MNAKMAYKLLLKSPYAFNKIGVRCFEYHDIFVFDMRKKDNIDKQLLDSAFAVDKKTGEIGVFMPVNIPIEDFNSAKEIKDFK